MKKVIAIMMVLAIVSSVVFAVGETHEIKVTATIDEKVPAFQLNVGEVYTNESGLSWEADAAVENSEPVSYTARYTKNDVGATIAFESDTATERQVTVISYLVNDAKTITPYEITFGGGVFTVYRNGAEDTEHPINPTIGDITVNSTVPTGISSFSNVSNTNHKFQVNFNGTRCTASTTTKQELARLTYSYDKDTTIDPGLTYETYITMTVEAK